MRKSTQVTATAPMGMDRNPRWKGPRWKDLRYCAVQVQEERAGKVSEAASAHGSFTQAWCQLGRAELSPALTREAVAAAQLQQLVLAQTHTHNGDPQEGWNDCSRAAGGSNQQGARQGALQGTQGHLGAALLSR